MPRKFAVCFAILMLIAACATAPVRHVFTLLPNNHKQTGSSVVSGSGKKRRHTGPGQAVTVAPGAPPGKPFIMPMEEVRTLVGPALASLPRPPMRFILYFPHNHVEFTPEARATEREEIRAIKERTPVDVSVVGHTDRMGTRRYNYQLSLERARAVAAFLIAEGGDTALPRPPARFILYFPHDHVELTRESRAKVREVIRTIKEHTPVDVSVVGHTDRVGTRRYNYRLSLERARAVASYLIAEGVDPSILAIDSHGENNPLVPTGDEVSEPRNRRVEVTVR